MSSADNQSKGVKSMPQNPYGRMPIPTPTSKKGSAFKSSPCFLFKCYFIRNWNNNFKKISGLPFDALRRKL